MDNFKYSLKTQLFGKKRQQIFTKDSDKQKESMSLEVHDPVHNVSHLIQMNKSQEQSGLLESKKFNIPKQAKFFQQDPQVLKFAKQVPSTTNYQTTKAKPISHSISTTSKIKLPIPTSDSKNQQLQAYQFQQQLQILKYILISNQQRLNSLFDTVNTLYRNTIDLYNNHERKLSEMVNNRCYDIARMFKTAILEMKSKQKDIEQLDMKVIVLMNTLKDSKESLRITKIKQQCIEALQKQQQSEKKIRQISNQSINFSLKEKQSSKRLVSKQFSLITCNQNDIQSVDSFLSSPSLSSPMNPNDQKSPFEANQLYQISSTVPTMNLSYGNHKETEYSFRKGGPTYPFPKTNLTNSTSSSTKNHQRKHSSSFHKIKQVLTSQEVTKQIWVDNLNCLRRKNGTYILDQYGNAVICSAGQYQKLIKQLH